MGRLQRLARQHDAERPCTCSHPAADHRERRPGDEGYEVGRFFCAACPCDRYEAAAAPVAMDNFPRGGAQADAFLAHD